MPNHIFSDRVAVVTGGARGIGRAICETLARNGARVAVNYERNKLAAQHVQDAIREAGGHAILAQADVSKPNDVERLMAMVRQELGPIDFLVNNAGIAETIGHQDLTFERWKRMFEVNVDGVFLATWAVKDQMIERRYGRIVNIASLAGVKVKSRMIHYATSKAAVISFTRHCAEAFAQHNIRVNCVAPGLTNTDLAQSANPNLIEHLISITPMGRIAEPVEIANVVKFLLSDDASFITGQTVNACGGRC